MAESLVCLLKENEVLHNLAAESLVFSQHLQQKVVLLWSCKPCVVIGRNQNPWLECNQTAMQRRGIITARRDSGGGTVYCDQGNLNCCVLAPRALHNTEGNLAMAIRCLQGCGIEARVGPGHCLQVDGMKISGSAFRMTPSHVLHHFTLLVDADLQAMHDCLAPCPEQANFRHCKGVASKRAKVVNLKALQSSLTTLGLAGLLGEQLKHEGTFRQVSEEELVDKASVAQEQVRLASWEWRYGMTPPFSLQVPDEGSGCRGGIEVRSGKVLEVSCACGKEGAKGCNLKAQWMEGARFDWP